MNDLLMNEYEQSYAVILVSKANIAHNVTVLFCTKNSFSSPQPS